MSFILEALKKSDKKRQEGTFPTLGTIHESVINPAKKRLKWVRLLLLVLILNAGVLLWLFGHWQQPHIISPAIVQTSPLRHESPAEVVKTQQTDVLASAPVQEPAPLVSTVAPVRQTIKMQQQPTLSSPAKKSLFHSNLDAVREKIYTLKELPLSVRKDIPEMHMSLHAFYQDNPSANLVRINGQIMRLGARLSDKYLLEEITSEGVVFLYSGYRFLVPRKNLRYE